MNAPRTEARLHSRASHASVTIARGKNPSGANAATLSAPRTKAMKAESSLGLRLVDEQRIDAPAVGAKHLEAQALDRHDLAALRQPAELLDHHAAHRVGVFVREARAEGRIEIRDLRQRLHPEA